MQPRLPFVLGLAISFGLAGFAMAESQAQQAQQADKAEKAEKSKSDKPKSDKSKSEKKADNASDEGAAGQAIPAGFKGFNGTIGGKVVSVSDDGGELVLHVNKVWHVNNGSTASNPDSIVGKTVTIYPAEFKNGTENERNKAWAKTLKEGEVIQVDCGMSKGKLRINDMTTGERNAANKELKKEDKQKAADKKKD